MNRRSFLSGTSSAAVVAASGGIVLLSPRRSVAQSSAPSCYAASSSAHAIAAGNGAVGTQSGNDWTNIGNSISSALSEWQASGRDATISSLCNQYSPSSISSSALPQNQILQYLQNFQPSYTAAMVQQALGFLDSQTDAQKQTVLNNMQTQGMSYYINMLIGQSPKVAGAVNAGPSSSSPSPSAMRWQSAGSIDPMVARITQPPPTEGNGGYNCATDGALIFAAGIAFATLTVMTLGSVDVLAGAAWGAITLWGGLGTTGWGVGHALAGCSF